MNPIIIILATASINPMIFRDVNVSLNRNKPKSADNPTMPKLFNGNNVDGENPECFSACSKKYKEP